MATIDKTKSKTYNFLSENKSIEDIKQQPDILVKEIKNKRHGGKTIKIIVINNTNNQIINDDLSENEIFYDTYDTVDDLNDIFSAKISKLQTTIHEQSQEIQQLKKENKKLKQSNINFDKFKYNAVTIYDEKQRKKTGIEKIHEEILPINNKIYFITTIQNFDNSINEKIIYFQQLTNGDIQVVNQVKNYENMNKYKNDLLLIEDTSTNKNNISFAKMPIKKFLSEQEKLSNWKISKSEWIIFISLSLLSITLLAIPVAVPALIPIVSTILWEKTLVSIVGIGIAWIVNKGIWTIATEKTKKVEVWIKQKFYSLIRKIPFVNKRNLGKTKEEIEIKKNVEKNIENLTNDKLETRLQTQYDILKQELDNKKDKNPDELISNTTINHNSKSFLENSSVEQLNPNNFDTSIRNTINQQEAQPATSSIKNWNKVKCLLTT